MEPSSRRARLPIGAHVALAVGGLLALSALGTAVAVFLILGLRNDEVRLADRDVPYAAAVATAALNAKGVANDERGFLMTGDVRFQVEADGRIEAARAAFAEAALLAASSGERAEAGAAASGFTRWVRAVRSEFATYAAGDAEAARAAALGPHRALRKAYETRLAAAQRLAASTIHSADSTVVAASSRSVAIVIGCLLVALAVGVALAVWLVRAVVSPATRLLALLADRDRVHVVAE